MRVLLLLSIFTLSCSSGFALKEQAKLAIYSFQNRSYNYKIENEIRESLCSKFNSSGYFQCRSIAKSKEILIGKDMEYIQKDRYSLTGNIKNIEFHFSNGTYIPFVLYIPSLDCQIKSNIYLYDNEERKILKTWNIVVEQSMSFPLRFIKVDENDPDLIANSKEKEKLLRSALASLYDEVYDRIMNEIGEEI